MHVEDPRVLGAQRQVAHEQDLGMEPGPVEQADGRDLQVVDQRADVDPAVLVGVFVGPVLQLLLLQLEARRVGVHHELVPGTGQDQQLVLRVGAGGLEELAERPVVLHAQLDRAALGVGLGQQHAVVAAIEPEEPGEGLPVLLEPGRWHEFLQ
jgi:hypothetical protein